MARKRDVDSIKSFLDDLWKQAQSMLAKGKQRTEQVAHAAQVKMDMYLLGNKRNDLYRQLGENFFLSSRRKKPSVKKQQKLFSLIDELREVELHEKALKKALRKGRVVEGKKRGRPAGARRGRPAAKAGKAAGRAKPRGRKPAAAKAAKPVSEQQAG